MYAITDEALALSVTEATMQDWLTAMNHLREAPAPVAAPWSPLWPEEEHPIVRRAVPCSRRRVAPVSPEPNQEAPRVAGARTVYWVLLALTLATMLAF